MLWKDTTFEPVDKYYTIHQKLHSFIRTVRINSNLIITNSNLNTHQQRTFNITYS